MRRWRPRSSPTGSRCRRGRYLRSSACLRDSITAGPRCYNARVPDATSPRLSGWALVLGASSGFGEATSLALARAGMNVFGVHLDRKATLANAERVVAAIRALGREARFFNVNAADPERRAEVVTEMERVLADRGDAGALRVLLHSLAFGTLTPYIDDPIKDAVTQAQMDMTLDVMAHSLVYWTQEVVARAIVALAHPDTYWITGNVIGVDGGEEIVA